MLYTTYFILYNILIGFLFPVQNFTTRLAEDVLNAELAAVTLEQPSPVSVLDITFYEEDFPSPVKKIPSAFQG